MKTTTTTLLAALILLAISCKKESSAIQYSSITNESSTQALSSDATELAGAQAVRIGTQVWKIKDLTTSYYRNGDKIPHVQDSAKWSKLKTGAWSWYNNDPTMGKLYNWYAVNDPRGLAPVGWHIPTDAEWTTLSTFLGGDAVAGGKMKATGTIEDGTGLWYDPNYGATNSSGFTGLPGGAHNDDGTFGGVGYFGQWWSSTKNDTNSAWYRYLFYANGNIYRGTPYKRYGFSVRCVKD